METCKMISFFKFKKDVFRIHFVCLTHLVLGFSMNSMIFLRKQSNQTIKKYHEQTFK